MCVLKVIKSPEENLREVRSDRRRRGAAGKMSSWRTPGNKKGVLQNIPGKEVKEVQT